MRTETLLQSIAKREAEIGQYISEVEGIYRIETLELEFRGYVEGRIRRVAEIDLMEDGIVKDLYLDVSDKADNRYVQSTLEGGRGRAPREWVLLTALQGHSQLAATYGYMNEFGLKDGELAEAQRILYALYGDHDSLAVLPSQFALLKGAIRSFTLAEKLKNQETQSQS